jgi:hypothetical protein
MIGSASLPWRAERASAFLALIGDHLYCVGLVNRSNGNHRNAAGITNRRRKLNRTVRDRLSRHHSTHARYRLSV